MDDKEPEYLAELSDKEVVRRILAYIKDEAADRVDKTQFLPRLAVYDKYCEDTIDGIIHRQYRGISEDDLANPKYDGCLSVCNRFVLACGKDKLHVNLADIDGKIWVYVEAKYPYSWETWEHITWNLEYHPLSMGMELSHRFLRLP